MKLNSIFFKFNSYRLFLPNSYSRSVKRTRFWINYTTLMLGNWAIKAYNDIKNTRQEEINYTFTPKMFG